MDSSRSSKVVRVAVLILAGAVLGLIGSSLNLWVDCMKPDSEACVWGRAYRLVSLGLGATAGVVIVSIGYLVILRRRGL